MGILLGTAGFEFVTPGTGGQSSSGDSFGRNASGGGLIAVGGTATRAGMYVAPGGWATAVAAKIAVYTLAGALVAVSDAFSSADGDGRITKPINAVLTNAAAYLLIIIPLAGYIDILTDTTITFDNDLWSVGTIVYASPQSTLPAATTIDANQRIATWLDDGSIGGAPKTGLLALGIG